MAAVALSPVVPDAGGRPAAAAGAAPPAVFAANAEAWAYSAEIGVPGPLGPLASHTTVSVDNSPHAQGASGLADPGFLIRAAAQLVANVATPAYCESAWPEGPDHADCGAPGGAPVAVSRSAAGDRPDATATAAVGEVAVGQGAPALTVAAQWTTSSASFGPDGVLHARADVQLSGIAVAGGALRIGTLAVHREASATGLPGEERTTTAVEVGGATVAGTPVAPGADPVRSLAEAAQKAFGDKITVQGLGGRQEQTPDGKLVADSSGLQILWRPQPDRSVRIVLGYGRVLVYATAPSTPGVEVTVPGAGSTIPGRGSAETVPPAASGEGTAPGAADAADDGLPSPPLPAAASTDRAGSAAFAAGGSAAGTGTAGGAGNRPSAGEGSPAVGSGAPPPLVAVGSGAPPPLVAVGRPLGSAARPPVRWVSPFLVLAQMTDGRQTWWFLLGLAPLLLAAWLSHRSGLGLLAPWAIGRRKGDAP